MKPIGVVSTGVLFLPLGGSAAIVAQEQEDAGYYLCDQRYPGVQLAVSVSL